MRSEIMFSLCTKLLYLKENVPLEQVAEAGPPLEPKSRYATAKERVGFGKKRKATIPIVCKLGMR